MSLSEKSFKDNVISVSNPIWDIGQKPFYDNSIVSSNFIEYFDTNTGSLNARTQFDLTLTDLSTYVQLANSYLEIRLTILQATGAQTGQIFAADVNIAIQNSVLSAFQRLELRLDSKVISHLDDPGHMQQVISMSKWSRAYEETNGAAMGVRIDRSPFQADTATNEGFKVRQALTDNGRQAVYFIPLSEIWSYISQNPIIIRGSRFSMHLFKENNLNRVFFRANGVEDARINWNKISLWMYTVVPEPKLSIKLEKKLISSDKVLQLWSDIQIQRSTNLAPTTSVEFQFTIASGLPQGIYITFRLLDDDTTQQSNSAAWKNVDVSELEVRFNSRVFPNEAIQTDFSTGDTHNTGRAFKFYLQSRDTPLDTESGSLVDLAQWEDNNRLFYIPLNQKDEPGNRNELFILTVKARINPQPASDFEIVILTLNRTKAIVQFLQSKVNTLRI